jgi:hypothetical protein
LLQPARFLCRASASRTSETFAIYNLARSWGSERLFFVGSNIENQQETRLSHLKTIKLFCVT